MATRTSQISQRFISQAIALFSAALVACWPLDHTTAGQKVMFEVGPCAEKAGQLVLQFANEKQVQSFKHWRDRLTADRYREVTRIEKQEFEGTTSEGRKYYNTAEVVFEIVEIKDSRGWVIESSTNLIKDLEVTQGVLDGRQFSKEELEFATSKLRTALKDSLSKAQIMLPLPIQDLLRGGIEYEKVYDLPQTDIARFFVSRMRLDALALPPDQRSDLQAALTALSETEMGNASTIICKENPNKFFCHAHMSFSVTSIKDEGSAPRSRIVLTFSTDGTSQPMRFRFSSELDNQYCAYKVTFENESPDQSQDSVLLGFVWQLD